MPNNGIISMEGQLCGMPLAGPESFSQQQLEYLKRALGVDETLLFEDPNGTGTNSGTLTEAYTNFERIRLEVGIGVQGNPPTDGYSFFEISPRATTAFLFYGFGAGGQNQYYACVKIAFSDPTTWSITHGSSIMHTQTSTSVSGNTQYNTNVQKCVVRIWGIHRIAGGNT